MVLQKTWNNTVYNIPQSGERGWATLTNFLTALADGAQTTGKQIIGRRTAVATPVTVTATTDCYVGVNVSLAASVVNLPVGINGQVFVIADESGAGGTYNITINPNGANTINGTTSYVMDLDKQVVYLVFNNGNWVVLSTGTSSAPITNVTDSATIDFTLTPGNLTAIVKLDSLDNTHINTAAAIEYSKLDLAGGIVNADVNAAAAIAYVKLNLADGIVNADINTAAAIAYSKLNLSGSIVNADVSNSAAIVYSKLDLTGGVVDADVNASAAIARSKIAVGTADHVVINSGTGALSSEAQLAATRGGTGVSSTATFPTSGVIVTRDSTDDLTNKSFNNTTVVKAASELRFNNAANTFYSSIKAGANSGNLNWTLPVVAPVANQILSSSDTSGTLLWVNQSSSSGSGNVAANDSNVIFTNADNRTQFCTPTATRTYTLPTTSVTAGDTWTFVNTSTTAANVITLQSSGANTVSLVPPGGIVAVTALVNTPSTAGNWLQTNRTVKGTFFTPVFTGFGTVSSAGGVVSMYGNTLRVSWYCVTGTNTASLASITIPFGMLMGNPIAASNNTGASGPVVGRWNSAALGQLGAMVTAQGTSNTLVYFGDRNIGANNLIAQNGNQIVNDSTALSGFFEITIRDNDL